MHPTKHSVCRHGKEVRAILHSVKHICRQTAVALLITVLSVAFLLINAYASMQSSVALEQEVRCGITEHLHGDACYNGDILVCETPEHSHDMNCYIVLLADNDINALLTEIENTESRSLESVIEAAQTAAEETVEAPEATETVEETTALVLNDHINTLTVSETAETDDTDATVGSVEDVLLLAVGDDENDGNYNANFYILLDGEWTCIGTMEFEAPYSNRRYTATVDTEEMVALINEALGTNLTRRSFSMYYVTSQYSSNYSAATIGASTTTFGSSTRLQTARSPRYVRIVTAGNGANDTTFAFYTVTLRYMNGTTETRYVQGGTTTALPEGFLWTDARGNVYSGGDDVTITGTSTFTASADDGRLRIYYDVNFPTSVSGVTLPASPTVGGALTLTDEIEENGSAVVRDVSNRNVDGDVTSSGHANIQRVIHFVGWQVVGTDTVLQPNAVLDWTALRAYATGNRIELRGIWEYHSSQTCTFYVKYDSNATTEGQAETFYTPCIFTSYVAGVDTSMSHDQLTSAFGVNIEAVTDEEVYEVDQLVRAKYGMREDEVYLISFPEDDYVFEQLKQYADDLTVDGIRVSVDDLNENGYAIRWYVFKCQSDSWHIDGKLVRKHGAITVNKTFVGNPTAVAEDKAGFIITAEGSESDTEYLTPDNAIAYDAAADTYTWEIDDVAYGEIWTFTETEYSSMLYDRYTEYIISDAAGDQTGLGFGSSVSVTGMTYATDIGETEQLEVDFTNVYRALDSIIIKKEDSETGKALPGAEFELYQNGELMTFIYDPAYHTYYYAESGTVTRLASEGNGFLEASVKNISFADGNITVREALVPSGYSGSGDTELGLDANGDLAILNASAARFTDDVLVIPNTSRVCTVTVHKTWLCADYDRQDIEVQLLANGRAVNTLFPAVEPSVILTADNGYSHTWTDLAAYANGAEIAWSVRETKIGDEVCRNDFTFPSWLVYYGQAQYTYDENGLVDSVQLSVSNDIKHTVLRITKMNMAKTLTLGGAIFSIMRVDDNLDPVPDFTEITLATGSDGVLIFEDLDYGTYRITETQAPAGYEPINTPVYVTLHGDGSVTVAEHFYAEADTAGSFSVIIKNTEPIPIPQTGGAGVLPLLLLFGMLMATAICIYKKTKMQKILQKGSKKQ